MTPNMIWAFMVPLMAFAIFRRVRSTFGRQPIRRQRMMTRIVFLAVILCVFGFSGLHNPRLLEGLLGGAMVGALFGFVGLRLTRFERDASGNDLYIPNPWIGGILTVLLVGRLAWRLFVSMPQLQDPAMAHATPAMGNSPLTLAIFGLIFGYYISYFIGLLVHHRRFERAQPAT
ncbi:CcdC protein domain-containing protein [Dyella sp. C11]|uniref:CcdC protein domain-containing protein n=1 Tax=Dyella sp. C11 TaxID=2126991 RepID=UPI000D657058|nr:CcdC protein domain-containing protein [Dyella sp. C11]